MNCQPIRNLESRPDKENFQKLRTLRSDGYGSGYDTSGF